MENIIRSYKNKNTYYIDNTNDRNNIIAETRQGISGLININTNDKNINIEKYFDHNNLWFMNDNFWRNPWCAGAQLSHYLFFLQLNPEKNKDKILNVLSKLDTYKKHNGWYCRILHIYQNKWYYEIFTGLDIIHFNYDNIKDILINIINEMLNLDPSSGGCNLYDFVYVLAKSIKINYRVEECRQKLIKIGNIILQYQQKDGGFSYNINSTTVQIYGKTCSPGNKQGGIHGTTLMCMSLCMIDNACNLGLKLNIPKLNQKIFKIFL